MSDAARLVEAAGEAVAKAAIRNRGLRDAGQRSICRHCEMRIALIAFPTGPLATAPRLWWHWQYGTVQCPNTTYAEPELSDEVSR